jgi:hypothetical protein
MNRTFPLAATLALMAVSCAKIDDVRSGAASEPAALRIAASFEEDPALRTVLQENGDVWWSPKESIHVFCGDKHGAFTASNTKAADRVFFNGQLDGIDTGVIQRYVAVYPYQAESTFDGEGVTATLAHAQQSKYGTFCDGMAPAVARTDMAGSGDIPMEFLNVSSGLKFSLVHTGITSVSFRGNDGEDIAGKVRITFAENGAPIVSSVLDGKKEITLTYVKNDPGNDFATEAWVYLTLLPQTFAKGFTVTFRTSSDEGTYVYDKEVTFQRSVWKRAGRIDRNVRFGASDASVVSTVTLLPEDAEENPSYPTLTFPDCTFNEDFIAWSEEEGHTWHGTEDGSLLLHNIAPLLAQYCGEDGLTYDILDKEVSVDGTPYRRVRLSTPLPYIVFPIVRKEDALLYEWIVSNGETSSEQCTVTPLADGTGELLFLIEAAGPFDQDGGYYIFPFTTQPLITKSYLGPKELEEKTADILEQLLEAHEEGSGFFEAFPFENTILAQSDLDYSALR